MTDVQTTNLKCCLLNAENLFLLFDNPPGQEALQLNETAWQRLSSSVYENKSLKKCLELSKTLHEIDADIIMLCEVGGYESLKNFNQLFMKDLYSPCLLEGNSDRNIDVGFLVKKKLPWYFDLLSNKHRPINYLYPHERQSIENGYSVKGGKITNSHKFSRDVVELRLFTRDKEKPFFFFLLTHLKSRLDKDRVDPNGFERRQAEMRTLLEIYRELQTAHPEAPVVIAGDFNGNASKTNTDEEFKDIYTTTSLLDVLELENVPNDKRATYYQVRNNSRSDGRQIDFAFLSQSLHSFVKAGSASVYRYKDEMGMQYDPPTNLEAKLRLPSDHYPLVFEFENLKVF